MKMFEFFLIFALNIVCGYTLEPPQWGGSNEYPQSMFESKNKKKCISPVKPSFTLWGARGYKSHGHVILNNSIPHTSCHYIMRTYNI